MPLAPFTFDEVAEGAEDECCAVADAGVSEASVAPVPWASDVRTGREDDGIVELDTAGTSSFRVDWKGNAATDEERLTEDITEGAEDDRTDWEGTAGIEGMGRGMGIPGEDLVSPWEVDEGEEFELTPFTAVVGAPVALSVVWLGIAIWVPEPLSALVWEALLLAVVVAAFSVEACDGEPVAESGAELLAAATEESWDVGDTGGVGF